MSFDEERRSSEVLKARTASLKGQRECMLAVHNGTTMQKTL